ncbi:MAG: hypothetical protein PHP74_01210 [Candidatus Gracilibacteria bacterium]|nr:hypothetical protein [Candidatus Gracilibacteria bacterium]
MDRFLVFICGFAIALLFLKYRAQVKDFIGSVQFAEDHLGGTTNLIILIAFASFIVALMYSLGTLQSILDGTIGRFFR